MKTFALLSAILWPFMASLHAEESADIKQLRETLAASLPELDIASIAKSPIPGLLELVTGAQVVYITSDGNYVIEGDLIDIKRHINITQQRRGKTQLAAIEALGENKMVVFESTALAEKNRHITVFTDTTCGYCRKLHAEINGLLSQGVSVRYLLYPRAGLNTTAHRELESVWCADNQQQAMTMAKTGRPVPEKTCGNPIGEHIALAQQVGLRGTPMIFLDNGLVIPGYRPPAELIQLLESEPKI